MHRAASSSLSTTIVDPHLQPFVRRVQIHSSYQMGADWELLFPYPAPTTVPNLSRFALPRRYDDMGMAAHWGMRIPPPPPRPQHSVQPSTNMAVCPCCDIPVLSALNASAGSSKFGQGVWANKAIITALDCGHVYHTACLTEQACVLCFGHTFSL